MRSLRQQIGGFFGGVLFSGLMGLAWLAGQWLR